MTEIRLHVTQERYERLTLNDLIALEEMGEGRFSARALRDILARFVVGEDGAYLPEETAQACIGELPLADLRAVAGQFGQEVARLSDQAVPPGGGSE